MSNKRSYPSDHPDESLVDLYGSSADDHRPRQHSPSRAHKPRDWREAFLNDNGGREVEKQSPSRDTSRVGDKDRYGGHDRDHDDRREGGHYSRRQSRSPVRRSGVNNYREQGNRGGYTGPRGDNSNSSRGPSHHGPPSGPRHLNPHNPPHNPVGPHTSYNQPSVSLKPPPSSGILPPTKDLTPTEPEVLEDVEDLDPEAALAERRRRRAEIMAKFSSSTSAAPSEVSSSTSTPAVAAVGLNIVPPVTHSTDIPEVEKKIVLLPHVAALSTALSSSIAKNQAGTHPIPIAAKKPVYVDNNDEEDDEDMFSIPDPSKLKKPTQLQSATQISTPTLPPLPTSTTTISLPPTASTLSDNFDDPEGYYRIHLGEYLDNGRYHVFSTLGKGMFAAVVKARVMKGFEGEGDEVAIKIVRSQESMYKAGLKEVQILNKLRDNDKEDKKHIVRLERSFDHRGHLCLVFECLAMNLRDVIKRYGKDVGLNMKAVRAYAHQLFMALSLLKKCGIMHADIKPDNILINENKSILKLCDLGSASDEGEMEITPYLVSRFYRAPEIILGLPYDCSLDIWSIGCTLYELYTGKILFPGRSNNQMLLSHMELKGKFNHKMIKKSAFGNVHFDEGMNFVSAEKDKITGQDSFKNITISKPTRDLRTRLMPSASAQAKMKDEEFQDLVHLIDLLDKCLILDSGRRITPREALLHPFLRS